MSISWPQQCLGPPLSRWLPAECSSWFGVPMGTGTKVGINASTGWCRHFGGGRLAASVLPLGGRRHFDIRISPWGAVWGSQFGTQGLLLNHHRASRNKQWDRWSPPKRHMGQGWGQAGIQTNTPESTHCSFLAHFRRGKIQWKRGKG